MVDIDLQKKQEAVDRFVSLAGNAMGFRAKCCRA